MRIAITGADGFVGRHTVTAARAAGHDVRPLVRRLDAASDSAAREVGDVGPDTDWATALAGCEAVVHLAAAVHESGPDTPQRRMRMRSVNVDGTARLARDAARSGVSRFVFVSSIKVMGETSSRPFVEPDVPHPVGDYASSKHDAERALQEVAWSTPLQYTVVRPPLVYGPGVGANFRALLALCDSPWPLPLAGASAPRSLLYVGNLADALLCAVTHPAAANDTFFVTDDSDLTVADLVARLRDKLNRPRRTFAAPRSVVRGVARLAGRKASYARLFEPLQANPSHLRSRLGWNAPYTVDEGLELTTQWYRGLRGRSAS
jgi:nucleoside-diphosphate-sugar epimerase